MRVRPGKNAIRKERGRRGLSLLLCLTLVMQLTAMMAVTADASQNTTGAVTAQPTTQGTTSAQTTTVQATGDSFKAYSVQNTYMLRAYTGTSPGTCVLYFGLCYVDIYGIERTEYIFPNNGAWDRSIALSKALVGSNPASQKYSMMKGRYGSELEKDPLGAGRTGLQTETVDDYLFQPMYPLDHFVGIDVMMREGKTDWTCKGLQLYKVDTLKGYDMYGYYSNDVFLNFTGALVGELAMSSSKTMNYTGASVDTLIQIRTDGYVAETNGSKMSTADKPFDSTVRYTLKIDIADTMGAGISGAMQRATGIDSISKMSQCYEAVVYKLVYKDTSGGQHTIAIPIVTSMLCYLNEAGLGDQTLFGIGQVGESLVVPLNLPGLDESIKPTVSLYYGVDNAKKYCKVSTKDALGSKEDDLKITGFQFYPGTAALSIADYKLTITHGSPVWYYTTTGKDGVTISASSTLPMNFTESQFKNYYSGAKLQPTDTKNYYLMSMTTFNAAAAGTKDDIYVKLNYKNSSNVEKSYGPFNVRTQMETFYGEWPSIPAGVGAYGVGASAGGTLTFLIQLADVLQFTGMEIYLADPDTGEIGDATDDYQVQKVAITDVQSVGSRNFTYLGRDVNDGDGVETFWDISRDYTSRHKDYGGFEWAVLISAGETKRITFGVATDLVVDEVDVDWLEYRYNMSYEDTKQNMGFTKTRVSYKITAKVADDSDTTAETGDSGSNNKFYFQLVFANGKTSGYVLANQQIEAGKFRSASPETFYINMNYDYGDIVAVRVIPDDTIDEGEAFDKLRLEYIEVEKSGSTGINPTWTCTVSAINNGWISIDYQDTGEENTSSGRAARYEGNLTRTYMVDSSRYNVSFLMLISTQGYNLDPNDIGSDYFDGSLFACVNYYDNNGVLQTESVDVFKEMALYQGKGFKADDEERRIDGMRGALNDQTSMLQAGTVNWLAFTLKSPGEGGIVSVDFKGSSRVVTTWYMDRFAIYRNLSGDGELQINEQGVYVRNYLPSLLAETDDVYYMYMPANGAMQKLHIDLPANTLAIDEELNKWSSKIGAEPSSMNDTLNVYVHMRKPAGENEIPMGKIPTELSEYGLSMTLNYTATDSTGVQQMAEPNYVKVMDKDEEQYIFYKMGVQAQGLTSIDSITLSARSTTNADLMADKSYVANVEYVVMERIRANVVIDTYYVYFTSALNDANDHNIPLTGTVSTKSTASTGTQKVYLQLGDGTDTFRVDGNSGDLAVAITYRTTNTMGITQLQNMESYSSRNVMLSKLESYTGKTVKAQDVLEIPFHENNVAEITGVRISKVGEQSVNVSAVSMGMYDSSGNCVDWQGRNTPFAGGISVQPVATSLYAGAVVPVRFSLTTASSSTEGNSSCNGAIKMIVHYSDAVGSTLEYTVEDLKSIFTDNEAFNAGHTAKFMLLLPDLSTINYLTFETYDYNSNNIVSWNLSNISAEILGTPENAAMLEQSVGQTFYEGMSYDVNLSTILLSATIQPENGVATNMMGNTDEGILVGSGETVLITPMGSRERFISGSMQDVTVAAYKVVGNASTDYSSKVLSVSSDGVSFNAIAFKAENATTDPVQYNVVIASIEVPSRQLIIRITVDGSAEAINQANQIAVCANVETPNDGQFVNYGGTDKSATVHAGEVISLKPVETNAGFAYNSEKDVDCKLYRAVGTGTDFTDITGSAGDMIMCTHYNGVKNSISFIAPDTVGSYQLVVYSTEATEKKIVLTIHVTE